VKNNSKFKQKRYCKVCKNSLRKYGKNKSGTQRWQCLNCKKILTKNRNDICKQSELFSFVNWILDKQTVSQNTNSSRSTFYRKTHWCWDVTPVATLSQVSHKVVFVDAVYIKRNHVCIVLRNEEYVLDWIWTYSENYEAYYELFDRNQSPKYVVTDGNSNCIKAIKNCWSDTIIQRCLFHIFLFVKQKLSMNPKLEAGQKLLKWSKYLMRVKTKNQAVIQSMRFRFLLEEYEELLNEKTYVKSDEISKHKRKWFYTHKNLRAAFRHVKIAFDELQLFQFIEPNIASTNNYLEGGVNARLKELRRCHRGLEIEKQMKIFDLYLLSRTEHGISEFIKKSTRNDT
jgi:hypothetical protein